MSVKGKRSIYAGGQLEGNSTPLVKEGLALQADIVGGMSVVSTATGFNKNANAATVAGVPLLIALEPSSFDGSGDVDSALTQNEVMQAAVPQDSEFYNVLVITGSNITTVGTPLTSNGDGKFKIANPATEVVYMYADEIVNLAADGLVRARKA